MRSSIGNLDSKKLYGTYFEAKRKSQGDIIKTDKADEIKNE